MQDRVSAPSPRPQNRTPPGPETLAQQPPAAAQSPLDGTSHILGYPPQHRDHPYDANHLRALQEENTDLQQNLVQTVVCIESLEAELQRTREELSHVKEKYTSLQQTHTGTKQANNLLGEHLHIASESLSSERRFLLNRVSQLNSELEEAHRTIAALQNINVPCLIKELLEKHFDSSEAVHNFLSASVANNLCAVPTPTDSQPLSHWLTESEAAPPRVTAFLPFKQPTAQIVTAKSEASRSPPLSVADISTAIYNKMAASYATRPQPLYPQSQQQQQQLPLSTNLPHISPRVTHVAGDCWGGKEGSKVTLLEQDIKMNLQVCVGVALDGALAGGG
ncbi:uncharacterized protein LOC114471546 [Gouania willdenowi]|uniref:uncharacterized protein LOC114471546 n=1 Tax=Gouania willdenowi TaxID=441366 RepID=UPI001055F2AE|nr:uncharacterized protein LOC114471546 [Gouania willdenowi]